MNKQEKPVFLIVDDDENIVFAFKKIFSKEAKILSASNGEEGLDLLINQRPSLAFLDITMPKLDGLSVLRKIPDLVKEIPIIVITGFGTMNTAIEAIQLGAFEYVTKPLDLKQLRLIASRALEMTNLKEKDEKIKTEIKGKFSQNGEIIGNHPAIQTIFKKIGLVAMTPNGTNVLITGASGTGKGLVAKAIHRSGVFNQQPFVGINCSALPENLLESELFGHEKGSFTGAVKSYRGKFLEAKGGTIFLDEIGDLPIQLQKKLLRVIEEREYSSIGSAVKIPVKARIIAATNRNLKEMMDSNQFRNDLFYRLNVFKINLPLLKNRKEDIPLLINYFISQQNRVMNKKVSHMDKEALKILNEYDYPGNVRELLNIITSAMTLVKGDVIPLRALTQIEMQGNKLISLKKQSHHILDMKESRRSAMEEFEQNFIKNSLTRTKGNVTRAALESGITRQSFQRIMRRHKINSIDFKN